jgi:hypothetical protein
VKPHDRQVMTRQDFPACESLIVWLCHNAETIPPQGQVSFTTWALEDGGLWWTVWKGRTPLAVYMRMGQ